MKTGVKETIVIRYMVDSREPILRGGEEALGKDFTQELGALYPDAAKELDANLPTPLVGEISITDSLLLKFPLVAVVCFGVTLVVSTPKGKHGLFIMVWVLPESNSTINEL